MPSLSRRIVVLWLFVCAFALFSSPTRADAPAASPMAGRFRYVGGTAEDAQRKAAIDAGIDSMFFAIRPIARWRLDNATRTVPWVQFTFDQGQIRTRGPDGLDLRSPETGAAVDNVWRGERTKVSQRVTPNGLIQRFTADEGYGSNEWIVSADGNTITVKVTIGSPRLPKTIVFRQTYRRER